MITPNKVNNTLSRTPLQAVFDSIIVECDSLAKELPAAYTKLGMEGISPAESGRATRYAALALKARAALYAASPLFNKNNDKELWRRAVIANKTVIDSCSQEGFKLGKYSELWGPNSWSNNEMIFVRRYYTSKKVNSND